MKKLVCIVCPNSCRMTVDDNGVIEGYKCKRGKDFATNELTNPKRTVCSTVATIFADIPVVSVRTRDEVPKKLIANIMKELYTVEVTTRLKVGDVVLANVCDSGVDIICTSNMD